MRLERRDALRNYADDQFDRTIDDLQSEAPGLTDLLDRDFQRARRQMTVDQKQMPRAAHQVAGLILGEEILKLGIADDVAELIREARRSRRGNTPGVGARTQRPSTRERDYGLPTRDRERDDGGRFQPQEPPKRRTLAPSERMPSFSTQRRDTGGGRPIVRNRNGVPDEIRAAHPGMKEADLKLLADQE